ncbi:MAG: ATP-binding protein [Bacteroidetes bacterium]|nr:ATP-binding protein [Bacteroidota bacterium]
MHKRIAITGPESTGKSLLTEQLAKYYNSSMVSEYVRDYFLNREYNYNIEDLVTIAKGQLQREEDIAETSVGSLFCDTEFISFSVWSEVIYKHVPSWITEHVKNHRYDLYLLCNIDIDWEADPLRKNSHNRQYIFDLFVKELENNNFNYKVISGIGEQRFNNAVTFVDELLNNVRKK